MLVDQCAHIMALIRSGQVTDIGTADPVATPVPREAFPPPMRGIRSDLSDLGLDISGDPLCGRNDSPLPDDGRSPPHSGNRCLRLCAHER